MAMYHSKKKMYRFIDKEHNSFFKKKKKKGMEQWFSMKRMLTAFRETWAQFLAPTSGGSQQLVTLVPGESALFWSPHASGCMWCI